MNCIYCKKKLPDDAVFCCYCGKKQALPPHNVKKRGNGQGSVFKYRGGYAAEITMGYLSEDGKMIRRSRRKSGFKTKKEAAAYLETLRAAPVKPATATIAQLWQRYLDSAEISAGRLNCYKIAYSRIAPALAHRKISELTVQELQAVTDTATTHSTQADIKVLLSHLYRLALQDDLTDRDRSQYIRVIPVRKTEREVFTDAEIAALWADFSENRDPATTAALVMIYTGMRPSEARCLKVENVHLAEHYLTGGMKTEKGRRRKIIIPDKLLPIFEAFVSRGYAFEMSQSSLQKKWNAKRDALGLNPALTLHCCRHTYLTRLTALNVSPAMLQELAGHEDYETTLNYTHLSISDRLEAVNRL